MSQTSTDDLGFNPDELRQRYRDERDKRVRVEANEQYTEITGEFAHYLDDPYIAFEERTPIVKEVQVALVGGGFGGMLVGARLHEAGVHDFTIIEKAATLVALGTGIGIPVQHVTLSRTSICRC